VTVLLASASVALGGLVGVGLAWLLSRLILRWYW
jgi:hypothetical protein